MELHRCPCQSWLLLAGSKCAVEESYFRFVWLPSRAWIVEQCWWFIVTFLGTYEETLIAGLSTIAHSIRQCRNLRAHFGCSGVLQRVLLILYQACLFLMLGAHRLLSVPLILGDREAASSLLHCQGDLHGCTLILLVKGLRKLQYWIILGCLWLKLFPCSFMPCVWATFSGFQVQAHRCVYLEICKVILIFRLQLQIRHWFIVFSWSWCWFVVFVLLQYYAFLGRCADDQLAAFGLDPL